MNSKELLLRICDRLSYMNLEDYTTAERQIVNLLVSAGYMKYNEHNEAVSVYTLLDIKEN